MESKKILIVEDDAFLRQIYQDTLVSEGYLADIAVDGEEGYTKIKEGSYNLVLVDILLPKLNGFEMLEKLKADPEYTNNKQIVFLTNLDNEIDIKHALSLGNGYLIKSQMTPGDLVKEVKMFLEKSEKVPFVSVTPPDAQAAVV
jgi:two-component system response regulator CpxR